MTPPRWTKLSDDSWGIKLSHALARPGDVVTVQSKDGSTTDVTLKACIGDGPGWALWTVLKRGETLAPPTPTRAQARRPLIRRGGSLLRLTVVRPEPPPHSDADAPPPEDE